MIGILMLTLLGFAPAGRAQFSNLDDLGQQFAKELKSHEKRTVAVADFETSGDAIPSQGHYFAQFLTLSIKHYGKKLSVQDHNEFDAALASAQITPASLASLEAPDAPGRKVLPEIVITGTIGRDAENYLFSVSARHVEDGRVLYSQNTTFRRTSFIDSFSEPFPPNVGQTIYTIDKKSAEISPPDCAACASPPYSDFARRDKVQGSVIFLAVISPEGRVVSLQAKKLIGDGLDERAFDTIKSWRLKPARARDGTPVYVMIPIEVTFRLH
ncbi:MAG: energy transducer TonB [Candidatus Acidiferrum sp.]